MKTLINISNLASLLGVAFTVHAQTAAHNALNFNGTNGYVSVTLNSPPANNYTLSAWVYLRTGGNYYGPRMAVLSATKCGGSIEFLIHSKTANPSAPQYLELGRCGSFNGFTNNIPVPLMDWTNIGTATLNYQFTDPDATNYPERFYQLVWPQTILSNHKQRTS